MDMNGCAGFRDPVSQQNVSNASLDDPESRLLDRRHKVSRCIALSNVERKRSHFEWSAILRISLRPIADQPRDRLDGA
jgi:hypothetical protein